MRVGYQGSPPLYTVKRLPVGVRGAQVGTGDSGECHGAGAFVVDRRQLHFLSPTTTLHSAITSMSRNTHTHTLGWESEAHPSGAAAAAVVTPHRQQGHHTAASSGTAPQAAAPHRKQRHRTAGHCQQWQHHKRLAGTALPAAVHRQQEAAISRRLPSSAGCRQQRGTVSSS
jgi:hypothetical protein